MATRTVSIYPSGASDPAGDDASYTSAAAMETAEDGNLVTGTTTLQINTVISDGNWNTADGAVTFGGWTTDATYDVTWTITDDGSRHAGIYSTSKYRIEAASTVGCIQTSNSATRFDLTVDGFQGKYTGTSNERVISADSTAAGTVLKFTNTILWNTGTSAACFACWDSDNTTYLINVAMLGGGVECVYNGGGTVYMYNCTAAGSSNSEKDCIESNGNATTCVNCAVFNNTDDFQDAFTLIDYCASDDGDGTNSVDISPGGTEATDWAAAFTDYGNGDFSIKDADSVLYLAGLDPDSDANIPSTDIAGNSRPTGANGVSIGAFENIAAASPSGGQVIIIQMSKLLKLWPLMFLSGVIKNVSLSRRDVFNPFKWISKN